MTGDKRGSLSFSFREYARVPKDLLTLYYFACSLRNFTAI